MATKTCPSVFGDLTLWKEGKVLWLTIPTGGPENRAFMKSLVLNEEERMICGMSSRDVHMRIAKGQTTERELKYLVSRIVRRDSYFRALLIMSRGRVVKRCRTKCANTNANPKFRKCTRLDGFCGGACAECVWQSTHKACTHHLVDEVDDESNDEDEDKDEAMADGADDNNGDEGGEGSSA